MQSHIDVHQHAERRSGVPAGAGQLIRDLLVVNAHDHVRLASHFDHAADLRRIRNFIRQQDAADTVMHQALDLSQSGAGEADGAGVQLPRGQARAFVVFEMRPEFRRHVAEIAGHALQVGFHAVEVHQKSGGLDFLLGHGMRSGSNWRLVCFRTEAASRDPRPTDGRARIPLLAVE